MTPRLKLGQLLGALIVVALLGAGAATAQTVLVTAVRDGSGNLKLISWDRTGLRLNAEGAQAGAVSLISVVRLGNTDRMVTAVRTADGLLKLIVWRVPGNGQITRLGSGEAGRVSQISLTAKGNQLVTAVRDGDHNLKVIAWVVTAQGAVNRLGEGQAGSVSASSGPQLLDQVVAAAFVGFSQFVATAVRDGDGNLKIIIWRVSDIGQVARVSEASAGAVTEISMIQLTNLSVDTAVRDSDGNLKIIAWNLARNGNVTRGAEAQAGAATQITAFHLRGFRFITAVRDGGGNLKLIQWQKSLQTLQFTRLDDQSAGAVSVISGSMCLGLAEAPFISFQTSVRDGGGRLKIITWRTATIGAPITRFPSGEASAGAVSLIATVCFEES